MSDLKPCPFCGGEAYHYAPGPIEHHIACKNYKECGADITRDTEAEAIAAWNARHAETCKNKAKSWGEFECSECEFCADFGSDLHRVRLCPDCGAKVVK